MRQSRQSSRNLHGVSFRVRFGARRELGQDFRDKMESSVLLRIRPHRAAFSPRCGCDGSDIARKRALGVCLSNGTFDRRFY